MFDSLDETVEALIVAGIPQPLQDQIEISFARPDADFAATGPTLNLFLYRVTENQELRNRVPTVEQRNGSYSGGLAPVRVDCSYLVTAWAAAGDPAPEKTEHRLLGWALKLLLQHRYVPDDLRRGVMKMQSMPLPTATIQSPAEPRGDFWLALGGKPRAALEYKVTIGVTPEETRDLGPPVQSAELRMQLRSEAPRERPAQEVSP
ncbi:Pvc16 family protein [Microbulbifer taiwanensis]|uniref:Pvc16 family protein n=1 Tax=Microbulbifer taiwanensis TaxID=986746 RepID=A0ABW1YGB8_9GAMM|nr:Pvc16 family protein [Microbulbifer taiwanensis]